MLTMPDIWKKMPNEFVYVTVAARDAHGVASGFEVISHAPTLSGVLPGERVFIIPTFESTEDDTFIVNGEEVDEILPPNLMARFLREYYGFDLQDFKTRILPRFMFQILGDK